MRGNFEVEVSINQSLALGVGPVQSHELTNDFEELLSGTRQNFLLTENPVPRTLSLVLVTRHTRGVSVSKIVASLEH